MGKPYKQLNHKERDNIAILRAKGWSFSAIGKSINRDKSTISREYKRNKNSSQTYLPSDAQSLFKQRKKAARKSI